MSDQPAKPTRSIWTLLNAVLPLVAFVVIGYIVWVSINPQPNAVPGAAAPDVTVAKTCLLYTSPSPRDQRGSRMPSSA